MKPAHAKDDDFLRDVAMARADTESLHVWWLGQSGFLALWRDKSVLFDPYLSDSLTRKYESTDKPHIRLTERVIAPERLAGIDVVTSSHNHTDHLDADTLKPLLRVNPDIALVIPEANRSVVCDRVGVDHTRPVGLNDDDIRDVKGLRFHGMPAAHEEVERDHHKRCRFMGYVVEIGPFRVYHAGDTRWVPGLGQRLRALELDVAFLPISGALEERRTAGNLWGQEAAALAHMARVKTVIPMHFDMFTFNTETPAAFVEACIRRGQGFQVLQNGERASFRK